MNDSAGDSNSKKGKNSSSNGGGMKRTWLTNVDYKTGGLISDKKKTSKKMGASHSGDTDKTDKKKATKTKILSKHHKEQHDNIISKKFKILLF